MLQLSLDLLGTFQAKLGSKPIVHFRSANVRGLLVYLALHPQQPLARDLLATLFWPEAPERTARANLRQSLYQLRKIFATTESELPLFIVTRQAVQLNPDYDYQCDVHGLLKALQNKDLEQALTHYKGDLLPGFACESLEFEQWLRDERERLHRLALAALSTLTASHLRGGRLSAAQALARRHLALEPWSETAHQQLIEALALAGDRTAALAQYEQCRQILSEELGVAPGPETVALAGRVQHEALHPVDAECLIGSYVLGDEIGCGPTGTVRFGRDRQTNASVAIKMLDGELLADDASLRNQLRREWAILQQLEHPNIVRLLATIEEEERFSLVTEYVAGGNLGQLTASQQELPLQELITIALALADALTLVHRSGILHGGLKPGNVLLDEQGKPRLSDIGLARLWLRQEHWETALGRVDTAYVSPETCLGEPQDERSDIWSFGIILFEMLAGEGPFAAATPAATIDQILSQPLPDIRRRRPDIPDSLEDLLYRMLAKDRADRLPSIRIVGAELEAALLEFEPAGVGRSEAGTGMSATVRRAVFGHADIEPSLHRRQPLPVPENPFLGRESELRELEKLLAARETRLVTITGPGGMGKTRLSLEVASRAREVVSTESPFPDGIFFVELASLDSLDQVLSCMATAFGFTIEREMEPSQQILNFLKERQILLLLDNFEHLLAPAINGAALAAAILRAAPGVTLLVTSRQKLNLHSEYVFVLAGLALPEAKGPAAALNSSAVQLFVQGARRIGHEFRLDQDSFGHVTRICQLAEGMPLGIVLAAAWLEVLTLAEIVAEMQSDIDFLASEMGDLPPRQRSMRAVIEHSWQLLSTSERKVMAALSVFGGSFAREAAQAISGASLRELLGLVGKSMLRREVDTGRFTIHVFLRQSMREKLVEAGEAQTVADAHSRHYLVWLCSKHEGLQKYNQLETLRSLAYEDQNIQAAWMWAAQRQLLPELLVALPAFSCYIIAAGREYEGIQLYQQALPYLPAAALGKQEPDSDLLHARSAILNYLLELDVTRDEEGQEIDLTQLSERFRRRGARLEEALTCQHLGYRALARQDFQQARIYFFRQIDIYEEEGELFRLPLSLGRTGTMSFLTGEVDDGLAFARQALEVTERYGSVLQRPSALLLMAVYTLYGQYDLPQAKAQFTEVSELAYEAWTALAGWYYRGFIALLQGDMAQARFVANSMETLVDIRYESRYRSRYEAYLSLIEITEGNHKAASSAALESVPGGVLNIGHVGLTLLACARDDTVTATKLVAEALSTPISLQWTAVLLLYVPAIAYVLAKLGRPCQAAAWLSMARSQPNCPTGWWQNLQLIEHLDKSIRSELSPKEWELANARGQELFIQQEAKDILEDFSQWAGQPENDATQLIGRETYCAALND